MNINKIILGVVSLALVAFFIYSIVRATKYSTLPSNNKVVLMEYTKNNPSNDIIGGEMIMPSSDGKYGIEMSYSFWMYIDNLNNITSQNPRQLLHVLHKGDKHSNPSQCPGIWLRKDNNMVSMVVKTNTFYSPKECIKGNIQNENCYLEKCHITNIPTKKWVHVAVVVINKNIDLYVNGFLKKRCLLKGLPRLNIGDVYITQSNNGLLTFNGLMSKVYYYNYAIPIWLIERLSKEGPSQKIEDTVMEVQPPYLASSWWTGRMTPK